MKILPALALALLSCLSLHAAEPAVLSEEEKEQGFKLLFDGRTFEGWEQKGNWVIQGDAMGCPTRGGDITLSTDAQYAIGGATPDLFSVMLHESGHAFHAFESYSQPLYHQRTIPLEFAEVASMLLASVKRSPRSAPLMPCSPYTSARL